MLQLIYHSRSTREIDRNDLRDILERSRDKNARRGVSGILLYDEGCFVQVLEGDDAAIDDTFGKIAADRRHRDVRILSRHAVLGREFGDWAMAFACPDDADDHALTRYHDDLLEFDITASRARLILSMFLQGMMTSAPDTPAAGLFTLRLAQRTRAGRPVITRAASTYLAELGRTLALAMPDCYVEVETGRGGQVCYNKQGDLPKGRVELF